MKYYASRYLRFITEHPDYVGTHRYCNICGFRFAKFLPFGEIRREAQCPVCGSLERHRHIFVHIASIFPFLKGKKILHFAPELFLKEVLSTSGAEYFDADLDASKATYQVDITNIPCEENYFDYIFCMHVLEHIPNDSKAMTELYRVLKPGGIAFLAVPLYSEYIEDPAASSPEQRRALYGVAEHVRKYNFEIFAQRLVQSGFDISQVSNYEKMPTPYKESLLGDQIILGKKM